MYRIKEIQDKLLHLVGWEQAYNPNNIIDSKLTESESNLYFQGAHALMTLDNVASIMPEDWVFKYPEWNLIRTYKAGQKVRSGNIIWVAKIDNVNQLPQSSDFSGDYNDDFGNSYWSPYNMLSDYIEKLTRDGITKAVQTFIETKSLNEETKTLLERVTLFEGAGRLQATVSNMNKIVGIEIDNFRSMGITTKIEKIGLQMVGGVGIVKVYLFHSSQADPVSSIDLNFTLTNGGFQWFDVKEWFLANTGGNTNGGGSWFVAYNQSDLPFGMQAINVTKDWSVEPCGTCGNNDIESWRKLMQYVEVSPFMTTAPETFEEFPTMWDVNQMFFTSTQNYGLNIELSVGCDLTDFIVSQRFIFQTVIQRQVAAIALRTMAMNPDVRVNRNQSNVSKMDILYELDGNTSGERPSGLGYDLKKSYDALMLDTKGIDRVCLKCGNKGVQYKSVFG
jgi:hypothetical protein